MVYIISPRSFSISQNLLSDRLKLNFSVLQSSVLDPLLLSVYTTPLSQMTAKYMDVKYNFYANDTQLFITCMPMTPRST